MDPIKSGGNWYVYARNNPLKYIDPDGRLVVTAGAIIAIIVSAVADTAIVAGIIYNAINPPDYEYILQGEPNYEPDTTNKSPKVKPQASGAGALKGNGKSQGHHIIPHSNNKNSNSKFDHQNHPLVKAAGVNLYTYGKNKIPLINHAGRHTDIYNQIVEDILDGYYEQLDRADENMAREALDNAISDIMDGIANGSIKPYDSKDVYTDG